MAVNSPRTRPIYKARQSCFISNLIKQEHEIDNINHTLTISVWLADYSEITVQQK